MLVKAYAINNGREIQKQMVQYEDWAAFQQDFRKKIEQVEEGYNRALFVAGLGKVTKQVIETTNKIIVTFSNDNIKPTQYVCEW